MSRRLVNAISPRGDVATGDCAMKPRVSKRFKGYDNTSHTQMVTRVSREGRAPLRPRRCILEDDR